MSDSTDGLALYHYDTCWFCGQVRSVIGRLGLKIEMRDIMRDPAHRQVLIEQGGSSTVPCLRIEQANGVVRWLYESADICRYLTENYGTN